MKKLMKFVYIAVLVICGGLMFYGCSIADNIQYISAYEIAVKNGFVGTEIEWLDSLKGADAKTDYERAVELGLFSGTEQQWFDTLINKVGQSAYELAKELGFTGTEAQWIESLNGSDGTNGTNGTDGKSAYDLAVENNFQGTVVDWLMSLVVKTGAIADSFSAESLFNLGVSLYEYTNDSAGFKDFMQDYGGVVGLDKVSARAVNQVVSIYTSQGAGSGVIYEMNGGGKYAYIVTNYHVVMEQQELEGSVTFAPAQEIHLYTYGAETVSIVNNEYDFGDKSILAEYIGGSAAYDLAVLKVSGEDGAEYEKLASTPASAVTFADTTYLQPGSTAIAVGNPMGVGIAVTSGVVSFDREYVQVGIAGAYRNLLCLRLDASINGGNSGGGVFDIRGNLIGITNAKYVSQEIENVANAILGNNVRSVAENIIYFYNLALEDAEVTDKTVGVHKYLIGYTFIPNDNPKNTFVEESNLNIKSADITVEDIVANSHAAEVGLQAGDIVRGIEITRAQSGQTSTHMFDVGYDLGDFMLTVRPGDEIIIIIDRPNEDTYIRINLNLFTVQLEKYIEYKNND